MNAFSHRILTEDINRNEVIEIVAKYFDSFTVTLTWGYWKGKAEPALSIEVIGGSFTDVLSAARQIREANSQECVLVFSVSGKQTMVIA